MDKDYIVYRCATCGFIMIALVEQVRRDDNYLTCMKNGGHKDIRVCGAYDNIKECMNHVKYRRNGHGAMEQE